MSETKSRKEMIETIPEESLDQVIKAKRFNNGRGGRRENNRFQGRQRDRRPYLSRQPSKNFREQRTAGVDFKNLSEEEKEKIAQRAKRFNTTSALSDMIMDEKAREERKKRFASSEKEETTNTEAALAADAPSESN